MSKWCVFCNIYVKRDAYFVIVCQNDAYFVIVCQNDEDFVICMSNVMRILEYVCQAAMWFNTKTLIDTK